MLSLSQLAGLLATLQAGTLEPAQSDVSAPFLVIVNAENEFSADNDTIKLVLGRLFLSEQKNWPNGGEAVVFARNKESAEQAAFRHVVLGKSESEVNNHWLRMKQINGESPPRSISSSRILLRQINMRPDAVSIITKNDFDTHAHAFEQVQVLFAFDGATDE